MKIKQKYIKECSNTFFYFRQYLQILIIIFLFNLKSINSQNSIIKIFPEDPKPGIFFGQFLKWNENTAIISAHLDFENGSASGSMYFFDLIDNTFIQTQKYFPADGAVEDYFAYSISTFGDFMIVGAHHDSDKGASSGAAYILKKYDNNWSLFQKIVPEDGKEADEFGNTVSIYGNWAAVCAYLNDDKGINSGCVYLYHFDGVNWKFHSKIFPNNYEPYSMFGISLEISENRLLVGAPLHNNNGNDRGAAYIFSLKNEHWQQEIELKTTGIEDLDQFGSEVKISNNYAFISAIKDDDKGINSGALYVFKNESDSNWIFYQKIVPEDGRQGDGFGISIEANDTELFVGSYFDDDNGTNSGSVYYYRLINGYWEFVKKITPNEVDEGDAFGVSVSLNQEGLLVGAYSDDTNGFFSGTAYFISRSLLNTYSNDSEITIQNKLKIYPTLFYDQINIINSEINEKIEYDIIDTNGNIIKNGVFKGKFETLEVKDCLSGIYIIKLKQNKNFSYFKIIKLAN